MTEAQWLYWATESRLERGPDGVIRSPHPGDWFQSYSPMLKQFAGVVILARVASVNGSIGQRVEGPKVRVAALPLYVGMRQATTALFPLVQAMWQQTPDRRAYFGGRLPGIVASLLLRRAKGYKRPFLANVVGDPQNVLAAGVLGPVGMVLAPVAGAVLRRQVRLADAVVYVTERYLQQLYPARSDVLQLARSNVELPASAFAAHDRNRPAGEPFRLISVGSQEQLYKGHDLLLRAVAGLHRSGRRVELHLVGAGRRQRELRNLAERLSIAKGVIFHGHVGEVNRVRDLLDASDVYVQPSRTEGMPRALLEAMARALPCAGSSAGGIPELLDPHLVFGVDDLAGLVEIIKKLEDAPAFRNEQGAKNQQRALGVAKMADPERYSEFLKQFSRTDSPSGGVDSSCRVTVAHLLGSLDRGGAEMRTLQLLQAVDRQAFSTRVLTLSGRTGGLADEYRAAGARIDPVHIYSWKFPWRFIALLRSQHVDVVHSHVHLVSGILLLLARLAGVPIRIAHFRSDGPGEDASSRHLRDALLRLLIRWNATQVIGVSPSALKAGQGRWRKALRGRVIPNGVDLALLNPSTAKNIRGQIVPIPDEPVILHLGRADIPTKNRSGAIRYFAAYIRSGGKGTLIFVGRDGRNSSQAAANRRLWRDLASRVGVADRVVFLQERDDIADILVSADVLLFTSTLEGLPGVILEARALGTPVVASTVPGAVFLAEQLPGVRLVSTEADESFWAEAIGDAVMQRPTPMARQAFHDAMRGSLFDAAITARSFERVWDGRN